LIKQGIGNSDGNSNSIIKHTLHSPIGFDKLNSFTPIGPEERSRPCRVDHSPPLSNPFMEKVCKIRMT